MWWKEESEKFSPRTRNTGTSESQRLREKLPGLSFHFSRSQNRKVSSLVFLCSETTRKRLLRRLLIDGDGGGNSKEMYCEIEISVKGPTHSQTWKVSPSVNQKLYPLY